MTKRAIDRLGAMSYGVLMLAIINGVILSPIQNGLTPETHGSLRVVIRLMSVAVNVGGLIVAYYCLFIFIRHLFTENKHVGGAGKALWLVLLLIGNVFTMPVYWYMHMVRDRLANGERGPFELGEAARATKTPKILRHHHRPSPSTYYVG